MKLVLLASFLGYVFRTLVLMLFVAGVTYNIVERDGDPRLFNGQRAGVVH